MKNSIKRSISILCCSMVVIVYIATILLSKGVLDINNIFAISNIIFSIIACMVNLSILWTIVIHTTILGIFIIIIISMSSGSDYTNKVNKVAEEKHKEFINEKENYWN